MGGAASPLAQGCSSQLEGRPRVWRTWGPSGKQSCSHVSPSAGLGWALRLTGWASAPSMQPGTAEVGRGQNGADGPRKGQRQTETRPWADLTTDPGYNSLPCLSSVSSRGGRVLFLPYSLCGPDGGT